VQHLGAELGVAVALIAARAVPQQRGPTVARSPTTAERLTESARRATSLWAAP
jgi:hypothetical protein